MPHPETGIDGTRIEIWIKNLPFEKYRKICDPDILWSYVLEPELSTVGTDARLILDNNIGNTMDMIKEDIVSDPFTDIKYRCYIAQIPW